VNAILLSLIGLAASSAAAAPKSDASLKETRLLIKSYGDCVIRRERRRASQAIVANVNNQELVRNYRELIDGTCIPLLPGETIRMKFGGDQFRYAIADALVRATLKGPPPVLDEVPALSHREPIEPSRFTPKGRPLKEKAYQSALPDYQTDQTFSYLSRYGECVVRVDPAAARALLLSDPESADEMVRFGALRTALGTCLPEGKTRSFGKVVLRGAIAINYFRLASAARRPAMAGAIK
jgi:hypothetical protein